MSSGHHKDDPAPLSAVMRVIQNNPGLRAHLGELPIISRSYRVPYIAGSSADGRVTYIDSQVPERLPRCGIEPDLYYPRHERPEWWLMVQLGLPYYREGGRSAHWLAHGIERMAMRMDGVSDEQIEMYDEESSALLDIAGVLKLPPEAFPPDLFLGVYEPSLDDDKTEDVEDVGLLPLLRTAQRLGERVPKDQVGYTDAGTDAEHCSICAHWLGYGHCSVVSGEVSAGGWCRRFEARGRNEQRQGYAG